MENENINNQESQNFDEARDQIYANALAEMRENTVPKDQYDKAMEELKNLTKLVVEGKGDVASAEAATSQSVDELRQKFLSGKDMSNLEYWETTLALRDAIMEKGGVDPFLPTGQKISATAEDVQKAQNVADVIRECIEYADGDSHIFTNELQRRTVDTGPTVSNRGRKR